MSYLGSYPGCYCDHLLLTMTYFLARWSKCDSHAFLCLSGFYSDTLITIKTQIQILFLSLLPGLGLKMPTFGPCTLCLCWCPSVWIISVSIPWLIPLLQAAPAIPNQESSLVFFRILLSNLQTVWQKKITLFPLFCGHIGLAEQGNSLKRTNVNGYS